MTQDSKVNTVRSDSESGRPREKDKNMQTKVLIRRLPPSMNEEEFLEQISPAPASDYMYFVKADLSLGVNSFSRAYINFVNQEDIFIFKDKFDGYVFLDTKGNEFPALVEFAPFQKIPKKRSKKRDAKCGLLDQDVDYIKFLEGLENPEEEVNLPSAEIYVEEIEAREKELKGKDGYKQTTPLIEYLKQRKIERQRMRDEKRDERKRRDLERKKAREEERRRRKSEKDSEINSKESTSQSNKDALLNTTKKDNQTSEDGLKLTLLKNPEREDVCQTNHSKTAPYPRQSHSSSYSENISSARGNKDYTQRGGYRDRGNISTRRDRDRQREKPTFTKDRQTKPYKERGEERRPAKASESSTKSVSTSNKSSASTITEDPAVVEAAIEKPSSSDSNNGGDLQVTYKDGKDPRTERRIRNKDRPSLEIYRPGMRRMSTQRNSPQKDTASPGNSGASSPADSPVPPEMNSKPDQEE